MADEQKPTAREMLAAPFPKERVSWRAGAMNRAGTKAMALAFIDARDVMNRLDDVFGIGGWQCSYERHGETTVCNIGVWFKEEGSSHFWIWKGDGAGETDFEAQKGALSDAFKRAAVRWGIGRYLYDLPAPWVPCESYEGSDGRRKWRSWSEDPWKFVAPANAQPETPAPPTPEAEPQSDEPWMNTPPVMPADPAGWRAWEHQFRQHVERAGDLPTLTAVYGAHKPMLETCRTSYSLLFRDMRDLFQQRKAALMRQGVVNNG